MKRYIYTLIIGVLLSHTSCVTDDPYINGVTPNVTPNADNGLKIIGIAEDYDKVNVSTRAGDAEFADSRITEMTMFIFKENGDMIQGFNSYQQPISSAVNIKKPNPTFLINASEYDGTGIIASMDVGVDIRYYKNNETDLGKCSIYIVANAYHQISHLIDSNDENGEIKSLDDLNNALLKIDATLSMPKDANDNYIGFPMIGTHEGTFDLSYNAEGNSDVANIPMKKIYSKILFTMQVNANQVVAGGPTPKFTIDRAEVYNVPTKALMGKYTGDYIDVVGDEYQFEFVDGDPDTDTDKPFVLKGSDFSNTEIYHTTSKDLLPGSSDLIEFGFYLPEHMVTPKSDFGYPANIPDNLKQYYKPKGVEGQKATFVRIHGSYTDHNGFIKKVSFDIYLGQNHTDSFEVRRNQQLTNKLTITGITNHKDAYGENQTNVSVDHRVNVSDQGYNLYMEREAILDAHFEVRPIDIELQKGSSMTIVIPTDEAKSWIALEGDDVARSGVNPGLYIDNENPRRGVRKYFTTNLVSELNNTNTGQITLKHSSCTGGTNENTEYFRVWFYFDENPNVYDQTLAKDTSVDGGGYTISDKLYRMEPVKFYYSNVATKEPDTTGEPIQVINFQQWNLWRVWNKDGNRFYDIEHEEEYLNNYASNAGYGPKQNGMAWGLDGLQLSHEHDAAVISQSDMGLLTRIINWIGSYSDWTVESLAQEAFKNLPTRPLYDFYLLDDTSETALVRHDNAGLHFNEEIVSVLLTTYKDDPKAKINGVQLHQNVNSAIAYCYNKNKRDSDGNVCTINSDGTLNSTNLKWFLPSIDQIEDIVAGAYAEFDGVFQNNMYWSCQPAYEKHRMDLDAEIIILTFLNESTQFSADYYTDNVTRARGTKSMVGGVVNGEIQYIPVGSGVPDISGTQGGDFTFRYSLFGGLTQTFDIPASKYVSNGVLDYSSESVMGNMPRSTEARIRAVYRSGVGTRVAN